MSFLGKYGRWLNFLVKFVGKEDRVKKNEIVLVGLLMMMILV